MYKRQAQARINDFYRDLYNLNECSDEVEDIKNFLGDAQIPQVTEEENERITAKITEAEVLDFIKTLNPNKAPGISGLRSGHFLEIWPYAGKIITKAINECLEEGILPESQRKGVIVLIPKQDKDQRIIGNLRPITLLNTFYKIISGVITKRLKPTLQRIIQENQKAYLPGRYIGEATRSVYDILEYSIKNKITGHAILIDFKKAFDSISHKFLKNTLKIFNFSDEVVHWINTILSGFSSQTLVNGHLG